MGLPISLTSNGNVISGWKEVRITRGIERIPSDFEISMTDAYTGIDEIVINPGDTCTLQIGGMPVITGYIDRLSESIDPNQHPLTISGRGKCQDLVDCTAIFSTFQLMDVAVSDIATKLCDPYGIQVITKAESEIVFSQVNLNVGETPFSVIDTFCKLSNLLCYENELGQLVITQVSQEGPSSGFKQGVNIKRASYIRDVSQQYSQYRVYPIGTAVLADVGQLPMGEFMYPNPLVKRFRVKGFIQQGSDAGSNISDAHAVWECNRRIARGNVITITTDSWIDSNGSLYKPNTQVSVSIPKLKVQENQKWLISEVTYHLGLDGTTCDLVLMPPQGFSPEPINYLLLPQDVQSALNKTQSK